MATEQEMCQAVKAKQKIVYIYNKEDYAEDEREGDPHIVYWTVNGHLLVDIYQTGGVQTDPSRELPRWKTYHLSDIVLVDTKDGFGTAGDYDPQCGKYSKATIICSIDI